jgi:hypothetical protein
MYEVSRKAPRIDVTIQPTGTVYTQQSACHYRPIETKLTEFVEQVRRMLGTRFRRRSLERNP